MGRVEMEAVDVVGVVVGRVARGAGGAGGSVGLGRRRRAAAPSRAGEGNVHVWAIDEGMNPGRLVTVPVSVARCRQSS